MRPGSPYFPDQPQNTEGPVFNEPWEAQVFSMTLALHEGGLFSWPEWAQTLGAQIASARSRGDPDRGDTYYRHWLNALERLLAAKGISSEAELTHYRQAWGHAIERTPHGSPIELEPADLTPAAIAIPWR